MPLGAVTDISRQRIDKLYPGIRPIAFRVLNDIRILSGRGMNIVQGVRSFDEQARLYAIGRTLVGIQWVISDSPKIVTNARPGLSWHCYGLAFDCAWQGFDPYLRNESVTTKDGLWSQYASVVRSHGMIAGHDHRLINGVIDKPHAEMSYGFTIGQALELHSIGGIHAVWAYCDKLRGVEEGEGWKS